MQGIYEIGAKPSRRLDVFFVWWWCCYFLEMYEADIGSYINKPLRDNGFM
jgi:hypothetical protein